VKLSRLAIPVLLLFAVSSLMVSCGEQQVDLDLLTEKEAAKAQVALLEGELGKANDALEEARRDLGVAQSEAAILGHDLETAEQEIREAPARLASLQSEIASLQSEIASLQGELSSSLNQVTSLEDRLAWEQTKQTAVIDQAPGLTWSGALDYIAPNAQTEQTFVPVLPIIVAVEVNIVTASPDRGDDTITLEILDDSGAALASVSADVEGGFDGWLRFDIDGGLAVAIGSTLTIRLSDAGNSVFGWKYLEGDVYKPGARVKSGLSAGGDFLFRTLGLAIRQ
jgi:hypothetical protein